MQIAIKYQPSYSLAIVSLGAGESIQAESGAMVSMTSNIQVETGMKGGVLGAVGRGLDYVRAKCCAADSEGCC